MEWQDEGLVLGSRRHGERDAILEVMTPRHGRHLGLVRGGRSPRLSAVLQPGNRVALVWRARLEDHLGNFSAEILQSRAASIMNDALALHAIAHLALLLRLLPERAPHPEAHDAADALCALIGEPLLLAQMLVRFEALMLAELGFGLDLAECAGNGSREDLIYVSPKSGRAVSREAGAPYADRLLALPAFLAPDFSGAHRAISREDILAGFALTGFFLERHVYAPRGQPPSQARAGFLARIAEP